jgi:hypothetical protein
MRSSSQQQEQRPRHRPVPLCPSFPRPVQRRQALNVVVELAADVVVARVAALPAVADLRAADVAVVRRHRSAA